jgi:hypothetical protein
MISQAAIIALLSASALAASESSGSFFIPRTGACRSVEATSTTTSQDENSYCMTFNWDDFHTYSYSYTNISDHATGRNFQLYMAALETSGTFSPS